MPTKKKRIGFIPREDVMKIIDKLSIENNLSNSKIISILVEEALSTRGIFNKKNGKITQSYQLNSNNSLDLHEQAVDFKDSDKVKINNKLKNLQNSEKTNLLKQINQEDFDLQTYKKFISFLKFQEMMNVFNN
tara:strand:- start:200 stop:598 length:399 start_codon:yes stop_codon:yes gene_type:complete